MTVAQFLHFKFASCDYDVNMCRVIALLSTFMWCASHICTVCKEWNLLLLYSMWKGPNACLQIKGGREAWAVLGRMPPCMQIPTQNAVRYSCTDNCTLCVSHHSTFHMYAPPLFMQSPDQHISLEHYWFKVINNIINAMFSYCCTHPLQILSHAIILCYPTI